MTRVTHLLSYVPLIYMCFFLIYWIRIYDSELIEFDEFVLEKQVNYAADAAVEELLLSSDTDQDYNEGEYILVEPDLAVTEFCSILCSDFGFIPTDETIANIKAQYIKALVIATWDGYYAYWNQPVDSDLDYEFVSTPKIPYFYTSPNGKQYAINLGLEKGYCDTGDITDEPYKVKKYDYINIPKDVQLTAINNQVGDALNYVLSQAYKEGTASVYEIPALGSKVSGAQPVDKITFLGVVEGRATASTSTITAECIGGAQIVSNDPIIGTVVKYSSGVTAKVYARSSFWRKKTSIVLEALGTNGGFVRDDGSVTTDITSARTRYFDSVFEAAEFGYYDMLTAFEDGDDEDEDS